MTNRRGPWDRKALIAGPRGLVTLALAAGIVIGTALARRAGAAPQAVQKLPPPTTGVDTDADRAVMDRARQDIEKHRKGEFTLRLVDADGKPVSGEVTVELISHEFRFGVLMNSVLHAKGPARERGEAVVNELFNHVVVPRHWWQAQAEPDQAEGRRPMDFGEPLAVRDWALAHGKSMRYHALFYSPPRWAAKVETAAQWRRHFETYVRGVAERFGDTVFEYDAINEPFGFKQHMMKVHGAGECLPDLADPEAGAKALRIARKHLPKARLVMLNFWDIGDPKNQGYRKTFDYYRRVIATGAPVDLVGFQGHFYGRHVAMHQVSAGLDDFASLGLPVVITEFNGPSRMQGCQHEGEACSPKTHAAWVENFYTLVFSKPYIEGLTRWFVYPTAGGKALDSGLVDRDGAVRPEYATLRRLLKETWNTRHTGELDRNGQLCFRGFYGAYAIRCEGGTTGRVRLVPEDARRPVPVTLKKE